jgi:hypothetical protein
LTGYIVVVLAVLASLLLGGCGSDSGDDETTCVSRPGPTTVTGQPTTVTTCRPD